MNKIKNHWMEGLFAGLASFLVIWALMLAEVKLGLILIRTPFAGYLTSSLCSAFFMGIIVGLLFAYTQKYILFEKAAFRGIAFFALFEMLCIAVVFLVPSSLFWITDIYASILAFLIDVSLTVTIGGSVIGITYDFFTTKKIITNLKKGKSRS